MSKAFERLKKIAQTTEISVGTKVKIKTKQQLDKSPKRQVLETEIYFQSY